MTSQYSQNNSSISLFTNFFPDSGVFLFRSGGHVICRRWEMAHHSFSTPKLFFFHFLRFTCYCCRIYNTTTSINAIDFPVYILYNFRRCCNGTARNLYCAWGTSGWQKGGNQTFKNAGGETAFVAVSNDWCVAWVTIHLKVRSTSFSNKLPPTQHGKN